MNCRTPPFPSWCRYMLNVDVVYIQETWPFQLKLRPSDANNIEMGVRRWGLTSCKCTWWGDGCCWRTGLIMPYQHFIWGRSNTSISVLQEINRIETADMPYQTDRVLRCNALCGHSNVPQSISSQPPSHQTCNITWRCRHLSTKSLAIGSWSPLLMVVWATSGIICWKYLK